MQPARWRQAFTAGLIYAAAVCVWRYLRDAPEPLELAAITVFHFIAFAVAYRVATTIISRRMARKRMQERERKLTQKP